MRLARLRTPGAAPWVRLGLANLHRPGAATPMLLVSVGLGLSTLAAVALIQGNMRQQIPEQLPANAPSFYFIDIQNDQLAQFEAIVRSAPRRHRSAPGAEPARPHRQRERRAGRAGAGHARDAPGRCAAIAA